MTQPLVSLIVCTYNRAEMLRAALESLGRQRFATPIPCELIVVDNGSSDQTSTVVREFAPPGWMTLRGVLEPRPGIAVARNRGLAESRGDWLAFFDDDQLAAPDWLERLLRFAQTHHLDCVAGVVKLRIEPSGCADLPRELAGTLGATPHVKRPVPMNGRVLPGAGNALFHRRIHEHIGGFDESLTEGGEDNDFFRRARQSGFKVWRIPEACVWHRIAAARLVPEAVRGTALRMGWYLGRIQLQDQGTVKVWALLVFRAAHGVLVLIPRWTLAGLGGNPRRRLAAQCGIWRCLGYLRYGLHRLFPRQFPPEGFRRAIDFRAARHSFPPHSP